MRVGLASWGGCGTWMLRDALKDSGIEVDATHSIEPDYFQEGKVIYLYGNPLDSVLSFKRRNDASFNNLWFRSHIQNIGLEADPRVNWSTIVDDGVDPFQLAKHFQNWYDYSDRPYEIAFLKYEAIPEVGQELLEFLGLPALDISFKSRHSNYKDLPDEQLEILMGIYGTVQERWQSMPGLLIK